MVNGFVFYCEYIANEQTKCWWFKKLVYKYRTTPSTCQSQHVYMAKVGRLHLTCFWLSLELVFG